MMMGGAGMQMPAPYAGMGPGGAAVPLQPQYVPMAGGPAAYPTSGPVQGAAAAVAGTTKVASNAGELLSEDDGEDAGAPGDKIARRQWKAATEEKAAAKGAQTDADLSKRLRQLYQNMDDDLAIKLDRERMEFMRREDQTKHQV